MRNKDYRLFRKVSLTKMGVDCGIKMNIIRNNVSEKNQIPLYWIGNIQLPNNCKYPGSLEEGQELRNILPLCYIGDLFQTGSFVTDMPRNTDNQILFLFTFQGAEFIYIISSLNEGITQDLIPYLSLSFNTEYEIRNTFSSS